MIMMEITLGRDDLLHAGPVVATYEHRSDQNRPLLLLSMSTVESGSSTANATAQGNKEGAEVDVKVDGQEAQVKWGRGELTQGF